MLLAKVLHPPAPVAAVDSVCRSRRRKMSRIVRRASQDLTYKLGEASLAAKQELAKQQIPLAEKPDHGSPRMPEDLTELGDSSLMVLMGKLTAWGKYLATQLALAE